MRRQLLISVALSLTTLYLGSLQAARAVEWINYNDPYYHTLDLAPVGAGPLELTKVFFQRVEANFKGTAMVSPDGRAVMYLQGGSDYQRSARYCTSHGSMRVIAGAATC